MRLLDRLPLMFRAACWAALLFAIWSGSIIGPLYAQPDPPVDVQDEDALAVDPATAAREAAAAEEAQAAREAEQLAVQVILSLNPSTPKELLTSTLTLLDLRADVNAQRMFERLLQTPLDENQKADLAKAVGSAEILRLSLSERLGPRALEFANSLMEAAANRAKDPARLQSLVDQLGSPDLSQRTAGIAGLLAAHADGAVYCLKVLADESQSEIHPLLLELLARMGPEAEGPALAAMVSSDTALREQVYKLLGRIKSAKAAPFLLSVAVGSQQDAASAAARQALVEILGHAPDVERGEQLLQDAVDEAIVDRHPYRADHRGLVEMWEWDDATKTARRFEIPRADAGVALAERMARGMAEAWPENAGYRRLHAALLLELTKMQDGFDSPISLDAGTAGAVIAALGAAEVDQILLTALDRDLIGAATAACEILGKSGETDLLLSTTGATPNLVAALEHGDRRLKFAALEAIMSLRPTESFMGAGRVPDAIGYFANSQGALAAIALHPRVERAVQMTGLLEQLGYVSEVATSGTQLLQLAQKSADTSLLLVDINSSQPAPQDLLRALRHNSKTSRLPVGLVTSAATPPERISEAERLASKDPLVTVVLRPLTSDDAQAIEAELGQLVGRGVLSPEERLRQSIAALGWMKTLLADRRSPLDVRGQIAPIAQMLYEPQLRPHAIEVLAEANSPLGQVSLTEVAADPFIDMASRSAAAAAFRINVAKHGVLLKRDEMLRQYDRYNTTDPANMEIREILGSILDTLEGRFASEP